MNSFLRAFSVAAVGCLLGCVLRIFWLGTRERDLRAYETQVHAEFSANRSLIGVLRNNRSIAAPAAKGAQVAAMNSTMPANEPHSARPTNNLDRGRQARQVLLRMPEFAPFLRADVRRRTMREYGEWFEQLDVTRERLESIKQLVATSIATRQDAFEAATAAGYRMGTVDFEKILRGYDEESEARLRQGLTQEEYVSYRNFAAAKGWTNTDLPQLEAYLAERGAPALTRDQKRVLSEAYVASRKWKPADGNPAPAVLHRMRNEQIGLVASHALEPRQQEGLVGYLTFINTRSKILAQLLRPDDPDGVIMTASVAPR